MSVGNIKNQGMLTGNKYYAGSEDVFPDDTMGGVMQPYTDVFVPQNINCYVAGKTVSDEYCQSQQTLYNTRQSGKKC